MTKMDALLKAEEKLRKLAADADEWPGQLFRMDADDARALRLGADALNKEAAAAKDQS